MKKMYKIEGNIPFWIMVGWFFMYGFIKAWIEVGAVVKEWFGWT